MPIANAASEIAEVVNSRELLGFKDYVVVAEAVEFRKALMHRSRSGGRSCLLRFAKDLSESFRQHRLDIQQSLVNRELPAMIHFVRDGKRKKGELSHLFAIETLHGVPQFVAGAEQFFF